VPNLKLSGSIRFCAATIPRFDIFGGWCEPVLEDSPRKHWFLREVMLNGDVVEACSMLKMPLPKEFEAQRDRLSSFARGREYMAVGMRTAVSPLSSRQTYVPNLKLSGSIRFCAATISRFDIFGAVGVSQLLKTA
jgi:hypothetical protein